MGELKVILDEELLRAFKRRAYRLFGYRKGSIKRAVEMAVNDFIERVDLLESEDIDLKRIRGLLRDWDITSVELQHRALKLWTEDVENI